jgi:GPH family glycoside/pentoside/hexuronide:cation symporter
MKSKDTGTSAGSKLRFGTKVGFGVGDLGGNLYFTIMGFHLLYFLTDIVQLGAFLAGLATAIGKISDAISDPIVGYLSDHTKSKWGRRRPYMFIGAITLFITMIVMFTNPGLQADQLLLFIWATIAFILLSTAYTLVNIPYGALTPELTTDFHEKTVLNGYRQIFALMGTFTGVLAIGPLLQLFTGNINLGWSVYGGVMGGVMMLSALVTVFAVKETAATRLKDKVNTLTTPRFSGSAINVDDAVLDSAMPKVFSKEENFFSAYLSILKDKVFLLALIPWTLHITGVSVLMAAFKYYFIYIYKQESLFTISMAAMLGAVVPSLFFWVWVSKKIGKKATYNLGMGLFAVAVLIFFFLGEQLGPTFAMFIMALAGVGFATHYVVPYALVPDIVEYDYSKTGRRREGLYYATWTLLTKIGQALAFVVAGVVLNLAGYIANTAQTPLALLGIKLLCGPIPALFFVAGVIVLAFYPINQAFYAQILNKIGENNK